MPKTPQHHQHTGPGDGGNIDFSDRSARKTLNIPTTTLQDTEYIIQRFHLLTGETFEIYAVGVQDDSNSAPTGLTFEVDDETNGVNALSANAKKSTGDPLASVDGPVDLAVAVLNDTGDTINASGFVEYEIA